jgi:hypothetical protein
MNRLLVIHFEGAPSSWHVTAGEVIERIATFDPDDVDRLQVWAVYREHEATHEVTSDFAGDLLRLKRGAIPLPDFLKLARAS